MSDDYLTQTVEESAYTTLLEQQPSAIGAIKALLAAGETPDDVHRAAEKMSRGNVFTALMFYNAALYISEGGEDERGIHRQELQE